MNPNANTTLTDAEATAWLTTPDRGKATHAQRCAVVRAESYKRQQERNARFEHLRNLLCKAPESPSTEGNAPATPDWGRRRREILDRIAAEAPATVRCTCRCRVRDHREWVFLGVKGRKKVWGAGDPAALREAYAAKQPLPECQDCLADRAKHEDGSPVTCAAPIHWRSLEEPDSSTVRTDEDEATLVTVRNARRVVEKERNAWMIRPVNGQYPALSPRYAKALHDHWSGACELPSAREPEAAAAVRERELAHQATRLTGIRDLDAVVERRGPRHALITVNPRTRYVTVQYGAKKPVRITMNRTKLTVTVRQGDKRETGKPYSTLDELEAAQERIARWMLETGKVDEPTDIQQARTQRYETTERMWAKVRAYRDLMADKGIEARVWNPERKEVAA